MKKHKWHVRLILNRLWKIDLQIDINKCKFHVQKIIFLELLMSIEELKMNSWKIQAVIEWSTFNNLTQIQFFIDFCNFYQHFIKNFSKIVRLIIQLTQKKIIFEWNEICQTTLNHMKRCMIKTSILRHFDQTHKTILEINSFNYVNDEVLSQYDDEEILHSIAFYSKNMLSWDCLHHSHEIVSKREEIEIWVNDRRVERRFLSVHIDVIATCR